MNLKLAIRLQDNKLKTADGLSAVIFDQSKSYIVKNVLLKPLYALPNDIIDVFASEVGIYESTIYRLLFEASLEIDQQMDDYFIRYFHIDAPTVFYIKRRYVIAWATWQFAKIFFRDYLKSVKKSKFLSDVKVSLEIEREPELINVIERDAKAAVNEILQVINATANMRGFVKGSDNWRNNVPGARKWMPSLGNNTPDVSMATAKSFFGGKIYKGGDQNSYGFNMNRAYTNGERYVQGFIQY